MKHLIFIGSWLGILLLPLLWACQSQPQPASPQASMPPLPPTLQAGPAPVAAPRMIATAPSVAVADTRPLSPADEVLSWNTLKQVYEVRNGELDLPFQFQVRNISTRPVTIQKVTASCGCTVVQVPAQPWILAPGATDTLKASMDVRGKYGLVTKSLFVRSDSGMQILLMEADLPNPPQPTAGAGKPMESIQERANNIRLALADRQAIFKNDCAECHVTPAVDKKGSALYATACAICHEAVHRAAMVPDLKTIKGPTNGDYWRRWVALGKEKTLMPAFAQSEGGPLTQEQIESLIPHLESTFGKAPTP